ncbi:hypothetical protein CLF_108278 [Clonorchis sinensis]|uniref:Uncharacterized protein n=1 Tax=Clonorchis sinensis TaxID=79923 RepID=G7YRG4_CLOSI|nr:hypothetical protein CLF_108278 [Clonorchis sinensis]
MRRFKTAMMGPGCDPSVIFASRQQSLDRALPGLDEVPRQQLLSDQFFKDDDSDEDDEDGVPMVSGATSVAPMAEVTRTHTYELRHRKSVFCGYYDVGALLDIRNFNVGTRVLHGYELFPDFYLRKFNCEALLAACGQEPQNQPASAATVVTLYFTQNGNAPFQCVDGIATEISKILSELEIHDVTVEGFEIKSRYGSLQQTSVHALNSLFELRKDLHTRWLDPLKVMKAVADKCLWIDDNLGQIVFSVYFDISNLKQKNFNANADKLSELKDPVNPNSETDVYIQQLIYLVAASGALVIQSHSNLFTSIIVSLGKDSIPEGLKESNEIATFELYNQLRLSDANQILMNPSWNQRLQTHCWTKTTDRFTEGPEAEIRKLALSSTILSNRWLKFGPSPALAKVVAVNRNHVKDLEKDYRSILLLKLFMLFLRWFGPSAGIAPFAVNCILTESERFSSTVLMSAYFTANEKSAAQIAEMKRQVQDATDSATGEEETENIIHFFRAVELTDEEDSTNNAVTDTGNNYDIYEDEEVAKKDTEETTTEEETDNEPEVSTDGGVDDLAIKITPLVSSVSSSPWDRLYNKLSGVSTKLYDVCDLLMPTLRSVKFECSAALVACSQEPRNQPADQGITVTLYYRLPPAESRDTCMQGVVTQVDNTLSGTGDVKYLTVSGYVLRTEWETSRQTDDTPVPTAKVIFDLRKDLFERWLTTSGDIKPLAINCLWTMASISKVMWMSMYFDFEKFAEINDVETWIENVLDQRGDSITSDDYVNSVIDKVCKFVPEPNLVVTTVATRTSVPTSPVQTLVDDKEKKELPESNEGTPEPESTAVDLPKVPSKAENDTRNELPSISLVTEIPVTGVVTTSSSVGTVVSIENVNKSLNEVFLNKSVSDIDLATNDSSKQPIHEVVKNVVNGTYGGGSATTTIATSTPVATSPVATPDGGEQKEDLNGTSVSTSSPVATSPFGKPDTGETSEDLTGSSVENYRPAVTSLVEVSVDGQKREELSAVPALYLSLAYVQSKSASSKAYANQAVNGNPKAAHCVTVAVATAGCTLIDVQPNCQKSHYL